MSCVILLALTLMVAPFLNGAANDWGWGIVAAGIAAAAVACMPGGIPRAERAARGGGRWAFVWWCAFLAIVGLQIIPLPGGLLGALSPARASLLEDVRAVGGEALSGAPVSFDSEKTTLAFFQILTLGVLFLLVVSIPSDRRSPVSSPGLRSAPGAPPRGARPASFLLRALIFAATIQAALVLVQYAARLSGSAPELPFGLGRLTGTYVNRNGLGNLLALAIPVTAGLLLGRIKQSASRIPDSKLSTPSIRDPGSGIRNRLRVGLVRIGRRGALWLSLALVVQMAGVTLSLSRGAMAAAGGALIVLLACAGLRFRSVVGPLAAWGIPLLLALTIGFLLGLDSVLARWASLDVAPHGGRLEWWTTAWESFRSCPVLGAGLGGYLDVSAAFRGPEQVMIHVEHAHCDYVEALAVLGVPGGLLAASALLLVVLAAVLAVRAGSLRRMGLAAGLLALAGHAAVDFPTAYGANVAWAVCLWAMLFRGEARRIPDPGSRIPDSDASTPSIRNPGFGIPRPGSGLVRNRLRVVLAAAAAVVAAIPPLMAAHADAALGPARSAAREVREEGGLRAARGATGEAWREAHTRPVASAGEAAAGSFRDAEANRLLAALLACRTAGDADAGVPAEEIAHARRRAMKASLEALALRPAAAETWMEHAYLRISDPGLVPSGVEGSRIPDSEFRIADRAVAVAARLAPEHPRVALREAVYWMERSRGTSDGFSARARDAYRRLLRMKGVSGPGLFLEDAWRRSGSMAFVLGCIPRDAGERTGAYFDVAERLAAEAGRVEDIERVESARRAWLGNP
jgi:O-antigen ligase